MQCISACNNKLTEQEKSIVGMWISTDGHELPTTYEFDQNHYVKIRRHQGEPRRKRWWVKDSTVVIEDNLILTFFFNSRKTTFDKLFYTDEYKNRKSIAKLKKFDVTHTQSDLTERLIKNSWTFDNHEANLLEFYMDHVGYEHYRYGLQRHIEEQSLFTHYVYWWIERIDGKPFLNTYYLIDAIMWGDTEQIISLQDDTLKTYNYSEDKIKNYTAKPSVNADSVKNLLTGIWVSDNANAVRDTTDLIPTWNELFRGKLYIDLAENGNYRFYMDKHEPYTEKWSLTNDCRTIVITLHYNSQDGQPDSAVTDYHYIKKLIPDRLALTLYSSQILTRNGHIYVNTHQSFNRVQ